MCLSLKKKGGDLMHEEKQKQDKKETDSANEPLSLKVDSKKKADEIADDIETIDFSNLVDQRKIIKRVENYGVETLNLAEQRSKNLSSMISKMTSNSTTDNQLDVNLEKLEKEIRTLDPSGIDFSKGINGIQKNSAKNYEPSVDSSVGVERNAELIFSYGAGHVH